MIYRFSLYASKCVIKEVGISTTNLTLDRVFLYCRYRNIYIYTYRNSVSLSPVIRCNINLWSYSI